MTPITDDLKLKEADIEFVVGDRLHKFKVIHNLPEIFGLSMENAVNSWVVRTKVYTADSLCKYIMSKSSKYVSMTEKQFKRIS